MCENCASDDEELAPVWRLPASADGAPELWCSDCRDRFTHEPADDADVPDDDG